MRSRVLIIQSKQLKVCTRERSLSRQKLYVFDNQFFQNTSAKELARIPAAVLQLGPVSSICKMLQQMKSSKLGMAQYGRGRQVSDNGRASCWNSVPLTRPRLPLALARQEASLSPQFHQETGGAVLLGENPMLLFWIYLRLVHACSWTFPKRNSP